MKRKWIVEKESDWFTLKPGTLIRTTTDPNMEHVLLALYYYKSDAPLKIRELHERWVYQSNSGTVPKIDTTKIQYSLMFVTVVDNYTKAFPNSSPTKNWKGLKFLSGKDHIAMLIPNIELSAGPFIFDIL